MARNKHSARRYRLTRRAVGIRRGSTESHHCLTCGMAFNSQQSKTSHQITCRRSNVAADNMETITTNTIRSNVATDNMETITTNTIRQQGNDDSLHTNSFYPGRAFIEGLLHKPTIDEQVAEVRNRHASTDQVDDGIDDMLVYDGEMDNNDESSSSPSGSDSVEGDEFSIDMATIGEDDFTDEYGLPFLYSKAMDMYIMQQENIRTNDDYIGNEKLDWIPDSIQCYVDLLYHLKRHRVDKKLFDVVVAWARHWTAKNPNIFKATTEDWKRKTVINRVSKLFDKKDMEPKDVVVNLTDGWCVSVPVVDFEACIHDLLSDPEISNPSNLSNGLDKHTWRPITSIAQHEQNEDVVLGEKDSGYLYRLGMNIHCPQVNEADPMLVRPLPLIFNIDKSHSDLHGNLAVTPVTVSLAMFDCCTQQRMRAWRVMATIPNLSAKKGKNKKRRVTDGIDSANDYHKVLKAAFSSFKRYYDMGGILWEDPNDGRVITLKPYIHYIIGDTAGNNELIGHYQGCKARLQLKDCRCTEDQLIIFPPVCSYVSFRDMIQVGGETTEIFKRYDENNLISWIELSMVRRDRSKKRMVQKHYSKHAVENAFDDLPLSDPYQGIVGITPQELLHVIDSGIVGYSMQTISDIIGRRSINSDCKEKVNNVFFRY